MEQNIEIPAIGESITEGTLVAWLKQDGEAVTEGEEIFELETDKASVEVPSPCSGVLKILVEEGSVVQVGQTVARVSSQGEESEQQQTEQQKQQTSSPEDETQAIENMRISPSAKRLLEEEQIPVDKVLGTGKDGMIIKEDVMKVIEEEKQIAWQTPTVQVSRSDLMEDLAEAVARLDMRNSRATNSRTSETVDERTSSKTTPSVSTTSSNRNEERVKMTNIRKRIAERLVSAQQNAAFLTTYNEANMAGIKDLRNKYQDQFVKKHGVKLGFMSFFVKACCYALQQFPAVNAKIDGDDIVYHKYFDIGVAVSTERGLVVPVLRNAENMGFAEIENKINDFAVRARNKKLTIDEMTGGTFTISNGGVFGSLMSSPIPNPPQTGILGMHSIQDRPIAMNGQVVIQPMMYLALSYDHRLIDGREAVGFLVKVKECVENPERMMFDI